MKIKQRSLGRACVSVIRNVTKVRLVRGLELQESNSPEVPNRPHNNQTTYIYLKWHYDQKKVFVSLDFKTMLTKH